MASPIQLFQSTQKYFQILGIYRSQPEKSSSFNWRILLAIFCYIQHFITVFAFFVLEANTVLEYGTSFYGYISMVYCVYYISILIQRKPNIFQLIESFQGFIEQRKCSNMKLCANKTFSLTLKLCNFVLFDYEYIVLLGVNSRTMYNELNEKIERMCGKIYFFMFKISLAGLVLLPFLQSTVNYSILGLKEESFLLPTPVTYVSH